jgi:hypothetical protein
LTTLVRTADAPVVRDKVSGISRHSAGIMSIGRMPPIRNNTRQSKPGGKTWVTSAEIPPPTGMPQNMMAAVEAAFSGLLISAAMAIMFGSAAPNPSPAQKRTAKSDSYEPTDAVINVNAPNMATAAMKIGLRPHLSASQPPKLAPITRPMLLMLNIQPICCGMKPNSRATRGAATPIAWMSKPSSTAIRKHRPTVTATL